MAQGLVPSKNNKSKQWTKEEEQLYNQVLSKKNFGALLGGSVVNQEEDSLNNSHAEHHIVVGDLADSSVSNSPFNATLKYALKP